MSEQKKSLPFAMPIGGGKNRDLITIGGKAKAFFNTIAKAIFSEEDAIDMTIINTIAGNDKGHYEFVENFVASSMAIGGQARKDHLQSLIGIGIPSWGYGSDMSPEERNKRQFKIRRRDQQHSEEDNDA